MSIVRFAAAAAVAAWGWGASGIVPGNAQAGAELFQTEQCIQCHSLNGKGGSTAPDLGRRVDRDFTPAVMASTMWNHAPSMWAAMRQRGIVKAELSPASAADLFAYFVSARYFDKPGDAGRGKQAFTALHCAECHGVTSSPLAAAPPVARWESLADPVVLAQQMWNHGARMKEEFAKKKLAWAPLTAQQLTDMLVYLQNLPETRGIQHSFSFTGSDAGQALFQSKGCAGCHTGKMALENRLRNRTLTEIAVDMWNHEPEMKQPPPALAPEEMRLIVGYVWARQYFSGSGSAERGKRIFAEQKCATCHESGSGGAPKLAQGKDAYNDITMISALWDHGPRMLELMTQQKLAWPRFTAQQMSDVIAYLNSL
jgi:mono/diheme cytochrome c family protein